MSQPPWINHGGIVPYSSGPPSTFINRYGNQGPPSNWNNRYRRGGRRHGHNGPAISNSWWNFEWDDLANALDDALTSSNKGYRNKGGVFARAPFDVSNEEGLLEQHNYNHDEIQYFEEAYQPGIDLDNYETFQAPTQGQLDTTLIGPGIYSWGVEKQRKPVLRSNRRRRRKPKRQ